MVNRSDGKSSSHGCHQFLKKSTNDKLLDVCCARSGAWWLSGKMPDLQSRESRFQSPFATVSKSGNFRSLSCKNEYMAIGNGGNMSDSFCVARMLPREVKLVPE